MRRRLDFDRLFHGVLVFIAVVTLAAVGFAALCALSFLRMTGVVP